MPSIEEYRARLKNGNELTDEELNDVRAALQLIAEQTVDRYFLELDSEGEES